MGIWEHVNLIVLVQPLLYCISLFDPKIPEVDSDALLTKKLKRVSENWASWDQDFHHPSYTEGVNKQNCSADSLLLQHLCITECFWINKSCINEWFHKRFFCPTQISQILSGHRHQPMESHWLYSLPAVERKPSQSGCSSHCLWNEEILSFSVKFEMKSFYSQSGKGPKPPGHFTPSGFW